MTRVARAAVELWSLVLPIAAILALALSWGRELAPAAVVGTVVVLMGAALAAAHHAETIARTVGEPCGPLVRAIAVTVITVALIVTLMLSGGPAAAALARDTVFAAVMITLNGVVGVSLLVGARRFEVALFDPEGAATALATMLSLIFLGLVVPSFATGQQVPEFSSAQLMFAAVASLLLYGMFVRTQTGRSRGFLPTMRSADSATDEEPAVPVTGRGVWGSVGALLVALIAVVGLATVVSPAIAEAMSDAGLPYAVVGGVIALLVLLPAALTAVRAAGRNRFQISVNLAVGSAMASIGLTIPAIAVAAIWFDGPVVLGLQPGQLVLLALTVVVGVLTVVPRRATALQGGVNLVLLAAFVYLSLNP